jgi:hypothetical protein
MSLIRFELTVLPEAICALAEGTVECDKSATIEINSNTLIAIANIALFFCFFIFYSPLSDGF